MPERAQSFENHSRVVPGYHVAVFGALTVNLAWRISRAAEATAWGSLADLVLAAGLILLYYYTRAFPLMVQDRVIRLEMRLRLAHVLPAAMAADIERLTLGQLIALKFAGDEELPGLVRRVLADGITGRRSSAW